MADDATHGRNRTMGWLFFFGFLLFVIGISLNIGLLTAFGGGAGLAALLGRKW